MSPAMKPDFVSGVTNSLNRSAVDAGVPTFNKIRGANVAISKNAKDPRERFCHRMVKTDRRIVRPGAAL